MSEPWPDTGSVAAGPQTVVYTFPSSGHPALDSLWLPALPIVGSGSGFQIPAQGLDLQQQLMGIWWSPGHWAQPGLPHAQEGRLGGHLCGTSGEQGSVCVCLCACVYGVSSRRDLGLGSCRRGQAELHGGSAELRAT